MEHWEQYVLANHSKSPPNTDEEFLDGRRVLAALHKIGRSYLKRKFQRDARRYLEEITKSVLFTVAARSNIEQGLTCFGPAIINGGVDHAPLYLLAFLLDGLLERGWIEGSEVEACHAENKSLVQEQRQLDRTSTRSSPDLGDFLSFCSSQAGIRARQHLFEVCIVTKMVKSRDRLSRRKSS